MFHVQTFLHHYARDLGFQKADVPKLTELRDTRASEYLEAFMGGTPISVSRLRLLEMACKATKVEGISPASSATLPFIERQFRLSLNARHTLENALEDNEWEALASVMDATLQHSCPSMDELVSSCKHGPGVTSDGYHSYDKWLATVTDDSYGTICDPLNRLPKSLVSRVSKFYSVPKNAWKERGICAEPTALQYWQQGVGSRLARSLYPYLNLEKGQERNRTLASTMFTDTLDLSEASDSITVSHITRLLGCSGNFWKMRSFLSVMSDTRSEWTVLPGKRGMVKTHSFASMGNGYCFPLLSWVVHSLCVLGALRINLSTSDSCGERNFLNFVSNRPERLRDLVARIGREIGVFGDDIVIPIRYRWAACQYLERFGFELNPTKSSFLEGGGLLKETCGAFFVRSTQDQPFFRVDNLIRLKECDQSLDALVSLCLVQRRLYAHHCSKAAGYLTKVISKLATTLGHAHLAVGDDLGLAREPIAAPLRGLEGSVATLCASSKSMCKRTRSSRLQQSVISVSALFVPSREPSLADSIGWAAALGSPGSRITRERIVAGKKQVKRQNCRLD